MTAMKLHVAKIIAFSMQLYGTFAQVFGCQIALRFLSAKTQIVRVNIVRKKL